MCEEAGIDSEDISGYTPRATLRRIMDENQTSVNVYGLQLRLKFPQSVG